jgi:hypothetical protein
VKAISPTGKLDILSAEKRGGLTREYAIALTLDIVNKQAPSSASNA